MVKSNVCKWQNEVCKNQCPCSACEYLVTVDSFVIYCNVAFNEHFLLCLNYFTCTYFTCTIKNKTKSLYSKSPAVLAFWHANFYSSHVQIFCSVDRKCCPESLQIRLLSKFVTVQN